MMEINRPEAEGLSVLQIKCLCTAGTEELVSNLSASEKIQPQHTVCLPRTLEGTESELLSCTPSKLNGSFPL